MSGYFLGAEVERDLDAIWEYIATDDIDAADRWIGKLYDAAFAVHAKDDEAKRFYVVRRRI